MLNRSRERKIDSYGQYISDLWRFRVIVYYNVTLL